MVRQAVQQRRRQFLVAGEDRDPFRKREVAGDHGGASLVPIRDEIEEQLAADPVERHEAELVDDQDVECEQSPLQAAELPRVACFDELADEVGRADKEHASFLFRRLEPERDRQVGLPGTEFGPARIRFSGAVTQAPRAKACTCVALTPSAAAKSNASRVFTSGNRASCRRWRMTDSWRDACSALSTSCR